MLTSGNFFAYEGKLGLGQVTLSNTSKSTQSLSFKDIRWEGEITPIPDAGYGIVCSNFNDWSGGATAGYATSREVLLPSGKGTGIFGGPSLYAEDLTRNLPAGSPAVFNLAAGETSGVQLSLKVSQRVATISGHVVATVSASDGEKEVRVPRSTLDNGEAVFMNTPMPLLAVDGEQPAPKAGRSMPGEPPARFSNSSWITTLADSDKEQLEPPTRHRQHREADEAPKEFPSSGQQPKVGHHRAGDIYQDPKSQRGRLFWWPPPKTRPIPRKTY